MIALLANNAVDEAIKVIEEHEVDLRKEFRTNGGSHSKDNIVA